MRRPKRSSPDHIKVEGTLSSLRTFLAELDESVEREALGPMVTTGRRASLLIDPSDASSEIHLDGRVVASGLQVGLPAIAELDRHPGKVVRRREAGRWVETLLVSLDEPTVMIRWEPNGATTTFAASWLVHGDRVDVENGALLATLDGVEFAFRVQSEGPDSNSAPSWAWKVVPLGSQRWAVRMEVATPVEGTTPAVQGTSALTLCIVDTSRSPRTFQRESAAWKKLFQRSAAASPSVTRPTKANAGIVRERLRLMIQPPAEISQPVLEALLGHGLFQEAEALALRFLDEAVQGARTNQAPQNRPEQGEGSPRPSAAEAAATAADTVVRWTGDPHPFLAQRETWEELLAHQSASPDDHRMRATLATMAESVLKEWPPHPRARQGAGDGGSVRAESHDSPQPLDKVRRLPVVLPSLPDGRDSRTSDLGPPSPASGEAPIPGPMSVARSPHPPEQRATEDPNRWRIRPLVTALGYRPDAAYGRFELAPDCAGLEGSLRVENLRVGEASVTIEVQGSGGEVEITVVQTSGAVPLMAILKPALSEPVDSVLLDGHPESLTSKPMATAGSDRWNVEVQLPLDGKRSLTLRPQTAT